MWIFIWDKELKELYVGSTKIKEVYHCETKVRPEGPWYNLDLENGQPIWRLHDWELWFRVNMKSWPWVFPIPVNWWDGASFDRDVSIDWKEPVRYSWSKGNSAQSIYMPAGKHYIKITPHGELTVGWADCIGNGPSTEIGWANNLSHIEWWLEWIPLYAFAKNIEATDNVLSFAFNRSASLTSMPNAISMPKGKTKVATNFMVWAWNDSRNITTAPDTFTLPQEITEVWDSFMLRAFMNCSWLESLGDSFNLPQNITKAGKNFLSEAFSECISLTSMPEGFNLPQGLTTTDAWFCSETWKRCHRLTTMPDGFNIPQSLTEVWDNFMSNTWASCARLTTMPDGFNIPSQLTKTGGLFMNSTWRGCPSLISMPEGFTFPEAMDELWTSFLVSTWESCDKLSKMPKSFSPPKSVGLFKGHLLKGCWKYSGMESIPRGFALPESPNTIAGQLFAQMFFWCSKLENTGGVLKFPRYRQAYIAVWCFGGSCRVRPQSPTMNTNVSIKRDN